LPNSVDADLIAIAFTVRTRGLRGELVADILTDFPERFEDLGEVIVKTGDGKTEYLKTEKAWFQKDRVVLKFAGVDSIEAAQPYINCEVCVPESEKAELGEDEFYDWELAGCEVVGDDGKKLGRVREVMRTGGTEILVVDREDKPGSDYLIPFAAAICTDVDIENKSIRINPPEGLLEF
jgi:16S rRNA processing protein RimM